jgi:hypothetical protein
MKNKFGASHTIFVLKPCVIASCITRIFYKKTYSVEIGIKSFKQVTVDKKSLQIPSKWALSIQYGYFVFYSIVVQFCTILFIFASHKNPIFGT